MSDVEINQHNEERYEELVEAELSKELAEEEKMLIRSDFMDALQNDPAYKDLHGELLKAFTLKNNPDGYSVEKTSDADYNKRLGEYLDHIQEEASKKPFLGLLYGINSEALDFTFDQGHQVKTLRLKDTQPSILLEKKSDTEWILKNFNMTISGSNSDAWSNAVRTALVLRKALNTVKAAGFDRAEYDAEKPFDLVGGSVELLKSSAWSRDVLIGVLAGVDDKQAFVDGLNYYYRELGMSSPSFEEPQEMAPATVPSNAPATPSTSTTPGNTPPPAAEGATETPTEAVPEVNPKYVKNMTKKMKEILGADSSQAMHMLERKFVNAVEEKNVEAIQHTGDDILARWRELPLGTEDGVIVAAVTASTESPAAEAGADSGAAIGSHEAFRGALKSAPGKYFSKFPYGNKGRGISLQLPNAESVRYSLVQDFLGKEGEAAIGLSEDKLKKTTVTLIEPGEVSRAGHVGQTAGTPYTWNGETWVDKDGDRLKVYWNTKFSYKTEEGSGGGGCDIISWLNTGCEQKP